jgi:MFS family permease
MGWLLPMDSLSQPPIQQTRALQSESDRAKIRALPWYLAHGALTSIFFLWTFGGSVFLLFLSEMGLPKGQIGIMLSFFPFAGLIALVFAPYAARIGRKRVFLACYGSRYVVIINLLFLPWILDHLGQSAGILFVFGIMIMVALLRAMGETAYYPWWQEFIPNSVRGWYSALATSLSTVASALALLVAGVVIDSGSGLPRFLWLIGIGTLIGILGIITMKWVPGGAPERSQDQTTSHFANMREALHNPNLSAYLKGVGGVMLGSVLLTSFLPLYIKEQMNLPAGTVVALDMVVMVGGALSSIVWGWAADRIGSRPILMSSMLIGLLLPVCWLFLPRQVPNAVIWCGLLYFVYGVMANGSAIGAGRLLFNSVIPQEKSTSYTAIYYAWMGLTGGIAPLLAGGILSLTTGMKTQIEMVAIDGQTILFILSFLLLGYGLIEYGRVTPDGVYTTRAAVLKLMQRIPFIKRISRSRT